MATDRNRKSETPRPAPPLSPAPAQPQTPAPIAAPANPPAATVVPPAPAAAPVTPPAPIKPATGPVKLPAHSGLMRHQAEDGQGGWDLTWTDHSGGKAESIVEVSRDLSYWDVEARLPAGTTRYAPKKSFGTLFYRVVAAIGADQSSMSTDKLPIHWM